MTKKSIFKKQLSDYLTIRQAALVLGVSPSTLRNWDKAGKLTAARHPFNGYRLYQQKDLEKILKNVFDGANKI